MKPFNEKKRVDGGAVREQITREIYCKTITGTARGAIAYNFHTQKKSEGKEV